MNRIWRSRKDQGSVLAIDGGLQPLSVCRARLQPLQRLRYGSCGVIPLPDCRQYAVVY